MDDFSGSGSQPIARSGSGSPSDEDVLLASSCPKKRAGRKKFKETRHPVYRGIRLRNGNRWVCEVRTPINNSRIWLGSYPTAEMAARAHDVAALALRGRTACLNFADSAWRLPVPVSTDTRDIQRAAAEAAELFRPPELEEPPTQDDNNNVQVQYNNEQLPPAVEDAQMNNNNNYNNNYPYNNTDNYSYNVVPESASSSYNNYMDEEAVFNMPSYIDDMAEGLMVPPPRNPSTGDNENENDNDNGNGNGNGEFSLWNF